MKRLILQLLIFTMCLSSCHRIKNIEQEFNNLQNSRNVISEGIFSKQIKITAEHEVNENLLNLFANFHPINKDICNNTIFPWDTSIYPNKINDDDNDGYYFRPPYSNNTIPCRSENYNYYSYDIKNKVFTKLVNDSYYSLFTDHDRGSTYYYIYSPEWTLSNINGKFLFLINKNHEEMSLSNNEIIEFILNEFKETVFDNDFIMETIKQISNTSIVSRYGMELLSSLKTDEEKDEKNVKFEHESNSLFYLVNRLNIYFGVNVDFYNEYDEIRQVLRAQIYDNGFYIYSPSRVVFYDIKNNQVVEYTFDINLLELSEDNNIWIHVSKDTDKFYISVYDNKTLKIYEYNFL